ncbi:hypothetical protein V6N13_020664 [Hibiscus sabdariffa]|uniref:Uncharacterized protein n=1 Tax=Hibiscus sabdariffa TaxID=183260 RepID=A0ABR2EU56_9ROSI
MLLGRNGRVRVACVFNSLLLATEYAHIRQELIRKPAMIFISHHPDMTSTVHTRPVLPLFWTFQIFEFKFHYFYFDYGIPQNQRVWALDLFDAFARSRNQN